MNLKLEMSHENVIESNLEFQKHVMSERLISHQTITTAKMA